MSKQEIIHRGLGASEIAAVCGLNPYASPWDVWLAHTKQREFTGNDRTKWGHLLEPVIRKEYADVTGYTVEVPSTSLFHPYREWMRATPDGMVFDRERCGGDGCSCEFDGQHPSCGCPCHANRVLLRLFQAKNTGEWAAKGAWEDAPPEHVQLQEQWEMAVTGAPVADVCVLIGGWDWRMFTVHRDDAMIADLIEIGERFMLDTAAGKSPSIDHSEACKRHLSSRMVKNPIEWRADTQGEELIAEWRRLHTKAARTSKKLEAARNRVRGLFAAAQCGSIVWQGGRINIAKGWTSETVDYEHIARIVASSAGMGAEEFDALVEAATTKTIVEPSLRAPKKWSTDEQ